jgi:pilus assembly protein Flp/PilA
MCNNRPWPDEKGKIIMMKLLRSLKTSKSGASAAEYALIVAVMGGLVVAGALAFGGSLNTAMTTSGTAVAGNATKNAALINK